MTKLTCVAALVACTACSAIPAVSTLRDKALVGLGNVTGLNPSTPEPAGPVIPTDALAKGPGNVLMVTLMARNAVAAMTRVGSNNGVDTWRTAKGVTLSFKGGILVASRGLNEDLIGADLIGVQEAITAGTGTSQRRHSFLDSEDQLQIRELECEVTTDGPEEIVTVAGATPAIKVTEVCTGQPFAFTNNYWLDEIGGEILQSQQALARTTGFIKVNPL